MTHAIVYGEEKETMGIDKNGIRLSIGLEDPQDIIKDIDDALESI